MADEEHPEMFYNQVTLCVSYTRNEETEETVLIHLKENGGDEQTRFIRASIMRTLSTEEGDVSFRLPKTNRKPVLFCLHTT